MDIVTTDNQDLKESFNKNRRHSATPSDVLDDVLDTISRRPVTDDISNFSPQHKEYLDELSNARLRRLDYIENRFKQFAKFTEQRKIENKKVKRHATSKNVELNTNEKPVEEPKTKRRSQKEVSVPKEGNQIIHFTESPSFINGVMHDYQVEGLNWLINLYECGINGILADEMGLGKTLQAISLLGYLKYHKNVSGPHLIVVPLSTIANWEKEFQRFLPKLRVLHGHCYKHEKTKLMNKLVANRRTWDVVVTSYNFFCTHAMYFKRLNFQYVIVDEAQRCKNEKTQLATNLRALTFRGLLLLTGTPINNNLHELWALLYLLLPDIFRNANDFDSWFKVEDCIDPNSERAIRLKNILQPIMLRRIKADVKLNIPPKIKTTIFMPQTRSMRYWSKKVINKDVQVLKGCGTISNFTLCNIYPYLRQVTIHPYLMPEAEPPPLIFDQHCVEASSRLVVLDKLLPKLKARGSRVIIFSQLVLLLNILDDYLVWKGYKFLRLTGDTASEMRQEMLDEFNSSDSDVFIFMITTRTGGVGINLQSADTVIFFDIDPNPQQDFQAEDRAHRIGQLKQVHVIRFVIKGTVDESLFKLSKRKQALDTALIKKSLAESEMVIAVQHHIQHMETDYNIDIAAVDSHLEAMFEEIDNGGRTEEKGTLYKEIYLPALRKRSASEERELNQIKSLKKRTHEECDFDSITDCSGPRSRTKRIRFE